MDEIEKHQLWKDKVLRVKTICLDEMEKHPITNVSIMSGKEKKILLSKVETYMEHLTDEEILKRFNEIVCEKVLNETSDYTNYPVMRQQEETI